MQDDLRVWLTTKDADPYFYIGLIVSFVLFSSEIFVNSLVQSDFKYSFFFWLDIIATLSLIPDIRWINDTIGLIVNSTPSYLSVNAIPGVVSGAISSKFDVIDECGIGNFFEDPKGGEGPATDPSRPYHQALQVHLPVEQEG